MKRWILLSFALVLVINLAAIGMGWKPKAPEKPASEGETKPAEAPAPAEPAATPAPSAPEAPPKK